MTKDPNVEPAPVEEEHATPRAFPLTPEEKVEEAIDRWIEEFKPATVSRRPEVTDPRKWTYVSLRFEAGGHLFQRGFRYHYGIEVRDL